jgi:predicted metal-dependent phosphotriesterase family hydrolase
MQAQSVLGPVPAAELGLTLMHEHLLFDFSVCLSSPCSVRQGYMAKTITRTLLPTWVSISRLLVFPRNIWTL